MHDRRADFERFVNANTDALLRTAYLIVWDLPEAEDLVQETLLKVARRWPRVSRMDRPAAYARRTLINLALGGSRGRTRRRRELTGAAPPDRPQTSGDRSSIDERDELLAALAELPPRQRAVLVLRYFLDLSEADVAAAMRCSLGTVKSTSSRALARLERTLTTTNEARSIPTRPPVSNPRCERRCAHAPASYRQPVSFASRRSTTCPAAGGCGRRSR
jgi:RNA polymerase sigma-70 factor (sigma-E family)